MVSSSSPSAPILPTYAAQSTTASTDPKAFPQLLTRLSDTFRASLAHRRPWTELLDRSAISRPDSLSDALSRLRKNLSYFRVNYLAVVAAVLAVSLLSNPFSLLLLVLLFYAWSFLYLFRPSDAPPLVLLGRQLSDHETLGGLILLSVFTLFLTSVGSILMSALTVGAALVCAHGAFRVTDDLFLDDQEPGGATSGFLSFIGGHAAAAAGPAVVAARA
ncbi:putative PRA1 family protein B2 [Iris pallida]|uniref:PRA1 family protein n=1 Tax=Iris pallida TaxID=29817 RepID=A0AAX6HUL1_IRIPA|nr:putative PRA1 family protein B2 [Iris pallida]KAJ6844154.1 putative PRA1 family protein B2 [Iris pallida]